MALEDLTSVYGPYNNKGNKGTGESLESSDGITSGASKYSGSEKVGIKPTAPDPFGNIPSERTGEWLW